MPFFYEDSWYRCFPLEMRFEGYPIPESETYFPTPDNPLVPGEQYYVDPPQVGGTVYMTSTPLGELTPEINGAYGPINGAAPSCPILGCGIVIQGWQAVAAGLVQDLTIEDYEEMG